MTIAELLVNASTHLQPYSDSPRLDAEILLAFVVDWNRTKLLTHSQTVLSLSQEKKFYQGLRKREKHMPIAYITGRTEFFGLPLHVTPAVLIPRPFTELLVESVLEKIPPISPAHIVDVGTGSGAIALALASRLPKAAITGTDISASALRVAKKNARSLRLTKKVAWRQGSLLTPIQKFKPDVVIANLPYLTDKQMREPSIQYEPRTALYSQKNGLQHITQLMKQVRAMPSVTIIALELDPTQVLAVKKLLQQWSPRCSIQSISDGKKVRGLLAIR